MQRKDSCDDQERKVREHLRRLGIDDTVAIVIRDEGISGTKADRPGLSRIKQMVSQGDVGIIAVDEQSRLSRAIGAAADIQDLEFDGVRFISASENIDTASNDNWRVISQVSGMHHSMAIHDMGHRVRRGQEGRVLDDGSAGDYPFGYESYFEDEEAAKRPAGKGPKPKKKIRINEAEAQVVRMVFSMLVNGDAIGEITRELNRLKIDKGHRSTKPGWHHHQVRRMLANTKYIGLWPWGNSKTQRNSKGKKKQIPSTGVIRERPWLRIIDEETWNKAVNRLAQLQAFYGQKEHQGRRGPLPHFTALYPKSLLGGLLFCGSCGARLWSQTGGCDTYYGCPNHRKGTCKLVVRVPVEKGEKLVLDFLSGQLASDEQWLDEVINAFDARLSELENTVPKEVELKLVERDKIQKELKNLTDAIARGSGSATLITAIADREHALEEIVGQLNELEKLKEMPKHRVERHELAQSAKDLVSVLRDDPQQAALLLRKILGKVLVYEVPIPGKKRGYSQLRFHLDGWAVLVETLPHTSATAIQLIESIRTVPKSEEVCLDIGRTTKMDEWAPAIVKLREQGVTWAEIERRSGLAAGNAYTAWKRYLDDPKTKSG